VAHWTEGHGRATDTPSPAVFPGQKHLTASFATRRPRVQIPPAPEFHLALVGERPIIVRLKVGGLGSAHHDSPHKCTTGLPPEDRRITAETASYKGLCPRAEPEFLPAGRPTDDNWKV
jgi:hypothetical protein